MYKYHRLGGIFYALYVLYVKTESLEVWDGQRSTFNPSIRPKHDSLRPAISNLDDLNTETMELHAKFGYVHHSLTDKPQSHKYVENQQIGYIYNPALGLPLGYKKKSTVGYDSALGFGSDYKRVIFSIYHINQDKDSPLVFLANNRSLVRHFVTNEYGRDKPTLERIPGLLNSNEEVQVNVGPLNSRLFSLLGISAFFKNSTVGRKRIILPKEHKDSQEFAIKSKITGKFMAGVANNTKAKFKRIDECEMDPAICTFIWIPYEK